MRVVVVGAGIVGASAAYQVAGRGVEVVLVDRHDPGRATDAGAGIICPWISTAARADDVYRLHIAGACYYPELVERLASEGEPDSSYAGVGGLHVSTDEADLARVHALISDRARDTPAVGSVTLLDSSAVRQHFPPLRADLGGVHVTGGGRVDGRTLRDAMLRAATRLGVRQVAGSARLALSRGRVTGVHVDPAPSDADSALVAANAVVLAPGAWAADLLAPLGVKIALAPQKGQIVHLAYDGADTASWPIVQPPGSHYLLAFPGGRVVCGATRETGSGYDTRVTAAGLREVLDDALSVAPGLADARVVETRVGLRPLSDDGNPMLQRLPDPDNVVVATGLGATGLTAGPYVGAVAARLVLREDAPIDLEPFRVDRPRA